MIAAVACTLLAIRAARVGMSGDYLDPVARITAQDESFLASSAIRMVERGDWLTPRFMERYSLIKPPLVMWIAALSGRAFGVSRLTLRLPLALLCGLGAAMVFLIGARLRSWREGAAAAILLISNHLWNVSGAMVLTDALLASFEVLAMFCLFMDAELQSKLAFWGFAASVAGAILTKTVAGVLPLAAFGLFWLLTPGRRATLGRAVSAIGAAAALSLPWFIYEWVLHRRWFWTEHVLQSILGYGAGAPQQTTAETHAGFYLKRLLVMDPMLLLFVLIALPGLAAAWKKRSSDALLLVCWLAPLVAAPFAWRYRNVAYLIPATPPLAIAAACYSPISRRSPAALLAIVIAGFGLKLAFASQPWGLSFASGTVQKASAPLKTYCQLDRGNELISIDLADDLYATTLPLARLRYAIVSSSITGGTLSLLDFPGMGITIHAADFADLDHHLASYRAKLGEWGMDSDEPVGSLIAASNERELMDMVRAHPSSDFLFPARYRHEVRALDDTSHGMVDAGPDFFLLLSSDRVPRAAPPAWPCQM